ncbi:TonB-dependent receptor [Taibaiella sp. KBW10]|uniref:TonB-dependent receptor plug domain-containing protein n=1 Tax=Taibaiella sp. KBW10 TaxID=2153357 RepID=UPI000F59A4A4|nr:TonB-dependent receptor [Taibaiella sp. KBW10]RQO30952.1 TonB-dependent receptor [Taibaiella sp. KBW10]
MQSLMPKPFIFRLVFIGSLLGTFHFASAQDSKLEQTATLKTVTGVVSDAQNKEIMIGVTISSLDGKHHSVSDENGNFSISLPEEQQQLVFRYMGYLNDTLSIVNNSMTPIQVLLKEESHTTGKELNIVDVVSRRKTTEIGLTGAFKVEKIGSNELMKAACCNLSESFETTPSVDVGFTDAVSGYKQIQMLGLAGAYTTFTRENIPDIRGLAAITGLSFTPGTFVESMQLSKGTGSVVNGFEGTAGQINVEWVKPFEDKSPKWLINGYQSTQGRSEGNLVYNHSFNKHLSTSVLLHGRSDWMKVDMNGDNFLDNPMGTNFVGSNRWFYFGDNGLEIQGGFKAVVLNMMGGQKNYTEGTPQVVGNAWGYENQVNRLETWAKIGKVFPNKPYKSMGLQLSGVFHDQSNRYGARTYDGSQQSFYANYIYQTIINNTNNIIKFGASAQYDKYKEQFNNTPLNRTEVVPGAFVEYAYKYLTKFNAVMGLRADYHNLFGAFLTPRLHLRYAPAENTAIRASIGRAQRTANFLAENMGFMASSRAFQLNGTDINTMQSGAYPFKPEVAWNMGLNLTQKFRLNYRDGTFGIDYYFTNFTNQIVVDMEQYNAVNFYNLDGKSYSHSIQAQVDYELIRNLDIRLAYRFYDIKTDYVSGSKEKPLVAAQRAFANIGYETKNNWKFDYTVQWIGAKRVPQRYNEHAQHIHGSDYSPTYWMMNAQINKSFKDSKYEVYLGMENIGNIMQHPLIVDAQNPFGNNFDASLVWGSGMGRNIYAGFRLNLK